MKDTIFSHARRMVLGLALIAGICVAAPASAQSLTPFYHHYYSGNADHFYTTQSGSFSPYVYQNLTAYVWDGPGTGLTALNRYYHPTTGEHFYTIGTGPGAPWVSEGPACFVSITQLVGTVPLFRWYLSSGRHYYTTDSNFNSGTYEGIEGYVSPS